MRTILPLLLASVVVGLAATAGEPPSRTPAEEVAPFVSELTRAVVYVDLARAEVDRLIDLAVPIVPQATYYATTLRAELEQCRAALRAAGVDRLYVVVGLANLPQQPWFVVAPCLDDLDTEALSEQLPAGLPKRLVGSRRLTMERLGRGLTGSVLFVGLEETLDRLKHERPQPRPELAAAFAASGDGPIRAVFLPTDDDRRVVEELVPRLPDWLGGGPSTVLTRGLRWAGARVDLEPEPSVRLRVESAGTEAAAALHDQCGEVLADLDRPKPLLPEVADGGLTLTLDGPGGGLKAIQDVISAPLARRFVDQRAKEQLHDLALAMHNWHDTHKRFLTQANYDAAGRPLLSWRVHLLPYLGKTDLYEQFHLDETWDSEHNRKMIEEMPMVYAMPGSKVAPLGRTCYVRPVGESTSCPGSQAISFRDVTDGSSNTVLIVEVDDEHAVPWTKPEDLPFDPKNPARGLGGHVEGTARTAFCDGATYVLENLLTDPDRLNQLKAIFTRNGGELVRRVD